jgi:hypothetical protein
MNRLKGTYMTEVADRVLVHMMLLMFLSLAVPIAILVVLVTLAKECLVDRKRAEIPFFG